MRRGKENASNWTLERNDIIAATLFLPKTFLGFLETGVLRVWVCVGGLCVWGGGGGAFLTANAWVERRLGSGGETCHSRSTWLRSERDPAIWLQG